MDKKENKSEGNELKPNKDELSQKKENKEQNGKKNCEEHKDNMENGQENAKKKTGKISKVISLVLKIIIGAIILMVIAFTIRSVVYKKYDIFGYRFHVILSGSMEPTIKVKDMVITRDRDYTLQVGDIIAFGGENSASVHRIVSENKENGETIYRTKGDNNNCEDREPVKASDIVGKVVGVIPGIGGIVLFLKANIVIILIYIIAITIIIILIRRLLRFGRKE